MNLVPTPIWICFLSALMLPNGLLVAGNVPIPMKRVVVVPWSSKQDKVLYHSDVFSHVESILNVLGVYGEYFDIDSEEFPDTSDSSWRARTLGVVSFFSRENLINSERLYEWYNRYAETGLPWVAFRKIGFLASVEAPKLKLLFKKFGVEYTGLGKVPLHIKKKFVRDADLNYERKLLPPFNEFPPFSLSDPENSKHWLELTASGFSSSASAVFVTPHFSLAYGLYGAYGGLRPNQRQWQTNPFRFLQEGLGLDTSVPIPEVSVLNGKRVFFSHIDGDAFNGLSKVPGDYYCGELVEKRVIEANPTLPFGVSLVAAEVSIKETGNERVLSSARRLASLPNVEMASHTYNHPLKWREGKTTYGGTEGFSEEHEIGDSVRYLDSKVATSNPVKMLYWSGDCLPSQKALNLVGQLGLMNINGGDGRFDFEFNSIAFLAPLGGPVGKLFQVFAASSNEFAYTNGWTGRYFGFREVIETFIRTGSPMILKPINPYFHFYSAEYPVSLAALLQVIDWANGQSIAPIFPSQYAKSVMGFRSAKIWKVSEGHFRITHRGALNTLRIDGGMNKLPDIGNSKGVLGFSRIDNRLYISLNPDEKDVDLVFYNSEPIAKSKKVYVESVGGLVTSVSTANGNAVYEIAPFTRGPLILGDVLATTVSGSLDSKAFRVPTKRGRAEIKIEPKKHVQRLELSF